MNSKDVAPESIRKYVYTCKSCHKQFRVVIDVSIYSIHQAKCPLCQTVCNFDNRQGALDKKVIRQNPAPVQTPNDPQARLPRPKPALVSPIAANNQPGSIHIENQTDRNIWGSGSKLQNDTVKSQKSKRRDFNPAWLNRNLLTKQSAIQRVRELFQNVSDTIHDKGFKGLVLGGAFIGIICFGLLLISLRFPSLYLSHSPGFYIKNLKGQKTNRILGKNGELIGELFQKKTGNIDAKHLPVNMAKILIFVEDTDFYAHSGIKWSAVSRAFIKNIFSFGYSQGGSTITQQLARILLSDREKNILRKLKETSLAWYLEENLSKDEILAGYMSQVYLGHGSLGFDNAAVFYFEKPLDKLDFYQMLTLACLPSAPERYSPLRNPDLLENKMTAVYERMQDQSFGAPEPKVFKKEVSSLLGNLNKSPTASIFGNRKNVAPWVSEHIRIKIRNILGADLQYSSGLVIETTIDRKLQAHVSSEVQDHIQEKAAYFPPVYMKDDRVVARFASDDESLLRKDFEQSSIGAFVFGLQLPVLKYPRLQAAAVGIDSRTGEIRFMQGGSHFGSNNQLNRVIDMRRQTGSSIKPVVYSAAIESGAVNAATMLEDRPIFVAGGSSEKGYWLPGNYSGVYEGDISVRTALAKSQNIPAISVLRKAGLARVSQQFRKFFFPNEKIFNSRFREDETVAIGSLEMSPLEMATAFTAFGNNGSIRRPYLIKRILDSEGKVLYKYEDYDEFNLGIPPVRDVIRPDAAQIMVSLMKDSGKYGGVTRGGFYGDFIGKTGTSNQYRDTWFAGATADITAVVWVGYDNPAYSVQNGTGAGLAGPLWGRIMRHSLPIKNSFRFNPGAVQAKVCADDGTTVLKNCKKILTEYFLKDHLPPSSSQRSDLPDSDNPESKKMTNDTQIDKKIGNDTDFD